MSDWDPQPWETDGGLPWEAEEADDESSATDLWRGTLHLADWPENLAGELGRRTWQIASSPEPQRQ